MKTLTPTNLIAVEVPKEATKLKISGTNWLSIFQYGKWHAWTKLEGNFKILGEVTDSEISFDVESYVKCFGFSDDLQISTYEDYNGIGKGCWHKNDSFRSLLQSNGIYFENPMREPKADDYDYKTYYLTNVFELDTEKWQSYESKLIKGKLIILKQK